MRTAQINVSSTTHQMPLSQRDAWARLFRVASQRFIGSPIGIVGNATDDEVHTAFMEIHNGVDVPYDLIVLEVNRALDSGLRPATAPALLSLAAIGLDQGCDVVTAVGLAKTALDIAARSNATIEARMRAMYAAIIAPFARDPIPPLTMLLPTCTAGHGEVSTALLFAGLSFVTETSLAELVAYLDCVGRSAEDHNTEAGVAALNELTGRMHILRNLMGPGTADPMDVPNETIGKERRFGFWLSRLQAAWYGRRTAAANHAAAHANTLLGPLTPVADRIAFHLFAALALSELHWPDAPEHLQAHCGALRAMHARGCVNAAAALDLADAAREHRAGNQLCALRMAEAAMRSAERSGLHGIAALAAEFAARQAADCELNTAVRHYRKHALLSYRQWGALGRADYLHRFWQVDVHAVNDAMYAPQSEPERLQRSDRISEFGLSIAHEVNQPLAAITLHAATARRWLRRAEPDIKGAIESLALIAAAGQHASDIVRSVQRMASRQSAELGDVVIDQTINETLQLLSEQLREHDVEVDLDLGLGSGTLLASRVQIQQIFMNLLVNAIEALASQTSARRIRVETRWCGDHEIEVAVSDNGPGISQADRTRIFGSLFSTKPNNCGIGLSISQTIARAHGGFITVDRCDPCGACFRLRLPVSATCKPGP